MSSIHACQVSFELYRTSVKLLDIIHKSYGFSADLMNINAVRLGLVGVITDFAVICKDSQKSPFCVLILLSLAATHYCSSDKTQVKDSYVLFD